MTETCRSSPEYLPVRPGPQLNKHTPEWNNHTGREHGNTPLTAPTRTLPPHWQENTVHDFIHESHSKVFFSFKSNFFWGIFELQIVAFSKSIKTPLMQLWKTAVFVSNTLYEFQNREKYTIYKLICVLKCSPDYIFMFYFTSVDNFKLNFKT